MVECGGRRMWMANGVGDGRTCWLGGEGGAV